MGSRFPPRLIAAPDGAGGGYEIARFTLSSRLLPLIHLMKSIGIALRLDQDGTIARTVARSSLDDPDLSALALNDMRAPAPGTVALFKNAGGTVESAVAKASAAGMGDAEIEAFLRAAIRASAHEG